VERIIVEGRAGSSLFIVAEGQLEVLVRQSDGTDRVVDVKEPGDVIGEISLLTGAPRSATVRAVDGGAVYEIGRQQYEPIIKERPAIIDELALVMERNLQNIRAHRDAFNAKSKVTLDRESVAIGRRIRSFFFGSGEG
jgi:CRP-like cAMP-binding protein